jgi:ABC-2 type transport system permease protein
MTQSPINDLSYRHYDGPLNSSAARWWSIAKMTIQLATKKRGFWGWSIFSAWWYIILLAVFWFVDNFLGGMSAAAGISASDTFLKQIVWKGQFVHAFSFSQMILMVVTLLVGASAIANDNRANALLVYLSKPCTRFDYVFGKWLGVFILVASVSFVPMTIFYLYGLLSFQEYGFFKDAPWLFPKLFCVSAMSGALHASLSLGVSSLFNQGRLAGATYAGIFFLTELFTKTMQIVNVVNVADGGKSLPLVTQLYYASIDGLQIGLAKLIIGTNGSTTLPGMGGPGRRGPGGDGSQFIINAPNLSWVLIVYFSLIVLGVGVAWSRVKAVEVV